MVEERYRIATQYARAIINYFDPTYAEVAQLHTIGSYFMEHPVSGFFLRLSSIPSDDKMHILLQVIQEKHTPDDAMLQRIQRILKLLQRDHRLSLFMHVCLMVYHEYQKRNGIESCAVITSHEVDANTIQPIIKWLERHVHKKLEPYYKVDDQLIAGVRVRGETFFWEDSVARAIRTMKQEAHTQWGIS